MEERTLNTNTLPRFSSLLTVVAAVILAGCSQTSKSPDVSESLRKALDEAGLKTVTIDQDRAKGVVTLGGHVETDGDKARAEAVAAPIAAGQVVSDQIGVVPAGAESDAKNVNADLDKGIEQNLDAVLIQSKLHGLVKYAVKNHVVTLTGEVESQSRRREAERLAASVPNVQQVVNELQVKNQKATSSE
jgi:hyperosmotically inducible periplasmic protein